MKDNRLRAGLAAVGGITATVAAVTVGVAPTAANAATNACRNPVLASNLDGWGSLDRSWVTRDPVGDLAGARWAFATGGRSFYLPEVAVSAGQTWTFSTRDRVIRGSGTARIAVEWYGAGGRYLSEQQGPAVSVPASTATGGTWTPVSATVTAPAGAVVAHVLQRGSFGSAAGVTVKSTMCDYRLTSRPSSDVASVRHGWGTPVTAQSDEYNGTAVDLRKWGLFGAAAGQSTGCSPGFNGHGLRCASQTRVVGGYLQVTGTADGRTGGLYSRTRGFRYGRIEVRERAVPLSDNGGKAYHAVPLMWPQDSTDYRKAEIDFAERDVADPAVALFVHHDGTQSSCSKTLDSTQFHNYAIDWMPTSVKWYVDAELICTVNASISAYDSSNGGAQLDMFPNTGTLMRPARQDVDWVHMFANAYTQYR